MPLDAFGVLKAFMKILKEVKEVYSGYSGGSVENPTYNQVISGRTGHAEAIEVIYDSTIIDFKTLVKVFLVPMIPQL